ncbi:molybdopterin-dependent oxidoreductase [Methylobacter sp. G7]|uniref:molybdopterin-dependent oxidoreductase n=1 Tax=Methylobacter sp. G7 TaxID=3230117 RepID=UPI003D8074ED
MVDRRHFIKKTAGGLAALGGLALLQRSGLATATAAEEATIIETLPGKEALIKKTYRPPNYETPINYFDAPFTPNNRFFVRYHNAVIPEVKTGEWRLRIGGDAARTPLELSLEQLRKDFEQVDIAALCLCAGNRRGAFQPPVPGLQWGSGAMGNALWRGVRLKDVLAGAGIDKSALEVSLAGADSGVLPTTPDFVKSLPLAKALDENTLIAFEMNGEPLPHWNGFPARLIIPGWTATYWIKHLTAVNVISKPFDGYWMKTAYRIPKDRFPSGQFSSQETAADMPITEIAVNSLITSPADGQTLLNAKSVEINGVAWDGGNGIARVEVSTDGGSNWQQATLKQDYGRFSWRQWHWVFEPSRLGACRIMARATSHSGASQPLAPIPNPSGYHHNAVQKITIQLV